MVSVCRPAVRGGMAPRGGRLSEDQLQQGELRQRAALLQKPGRKHRLAAHGQTGQLRSGGAAAIPAAGQGGCSKITIPINLGEFS